jgi:23S rRNA (guanosine2251-2'-O)-methyltransferase
MKDKTDLLFGFHSVYEALRAGKRTFSAILMSKKRTGDRMEKIETLAKERGIRVEMVDPAILDKMTEFSNHQGIAARASFFPVKSAMDVVDMIGPETSPCFILVMENIEDPHNLGALIRTALSAGVDYLLIPKDRSAGPSSTVSRTSAGAMEHADIYMITNTAALLRALKKKGIWVFGLDTDGDWSLFDADLKGPLALVIGGENKGVRPLVKKECDYLLSIPHKGRINSLNASVAGAIAMYEVLRQRNGFPV